MRDKFLIQNLNLSSLDALNRQFHEWVENEYNAREHSTLHTYSNTLQILCEAFGINPQGRDTRRAEAKRK